MRNLLAAGAAAMLFTGCSPAAEDAIVIEEPIATETATAVRPANSCEDIAKLAAALAEPVPFESLRTGKARLGDRELDDSFTTNAAPAGKPCSLGILEGFGADPGQIFVANCPVFSSGLLDREANAAKAKAAFDTLRTDLEECLPKDWTSRDGSQPDADTTEMMIFESADDTKRAMDASFYTYPVQLKKEWVDGWSVTLNFQKDVARSAPDQP